METQMLFVYIFLGTVFLWNYGATEVTTTKASNCGLNEIPSSCTNPNCENTCVRPNNDQRCKKCAPGCICQDGYIRNSTNSCVLPSNCDSCDRNEELVLCPSDCPESCSIIMDDSLCPPPNPDTCIATCRCKKNYKRNKVGKCIHISKCKKKCDLNEQWNICPQSCEDTSCKNYVYGIASYCPQPSDISLSGQLQHCYPPRCECLPGFVRKDGNCVSPTECCEDPNTQLVKCPYKCISSCDQAPYKNCTVECAQQECVCMDNYVLDASGRCVLPQECPEKKCEGNHEVYVQCPKGCPPEASCKEYLNNIDKMIIPKIPPVCTPKCKCQSGYFRSILGQCVRPENCCKDPNAAVVVCPNPCPGGTCENPEFSQCQQPCVTRGCQCKAGYVKESEYNKTCVLLSNCQ